MESILQLDSDLFLYLNSLGSKTWDGFWMFITNKKSPIPLYALLLFFLYKNLGPKKTLYTLLVVGIMILISDQVTRFFKFELLLRQRPCYNLEDQVRLVKDWCGSKGGYFSAHATNAMALSVFLGLVLKPYYRHITWLLFVYAFMVGYSRIYIGVHYPGDVLTGFVFGAILAFIMFKLLLKIFNRYC